MVKFIIAILITVFNINAVIGNSKVCTMTITHDVKCLGKINYFELTGFIPSDIKNKQRIIDIRFPKSYPHRIFTKNGIKYYSIEIQSNVKNSFKLTIEYDIELFNYNFKLARFYKYGVNDTLNLNKFLKHNFYAKKNHKKIKAIAQKITGKSDYENTIQIFNYVLDHLHYDNTIKENIGPIVALKLGKGDCTEYSDLMVSICRAKGIPSRVVTGCMTLSGENPNHNWVEVYLKDFGWFPIDPSLSDNNLGLLFHNIENKYIYFNKSRTDKILGSSTYIYNWNAEPYSSVNVNTNYSCNLISNNIYLKALLYYNSEYYQKTIESINQLLPLDSKNVSYISLKALALTQQEKFEGAYILLKDLPTNSYHDNQKMTAHYTLSKFHSIKNESDKSLQHLKKAIEYGILNFIKLEDDKDLKEIIKLPEYVSFMQGKNRIGTPIEN